VLFEDAPARDRAPKPTPEVLEGYLLSVLGELLRVAPGRIDRGRSLLSLGVDSLAAAALKARVESDWGLDVPLDRVLADCNVEQLAATLADHPADAPARTVASKADPAAGSPLSFGQEALWYLRHLAPTSAAYNIAIPARCRTPLDERVLRHAFEDLWCWHAALRTEILTAGGQRASSHATRRLSR
jgi:hypothetical protein